MELEDMNQKGKAIILVTHDESVKHRGKREVEL